MKNKSESKRTIQPQKMNVPESHDKSRLLEAILDNMDTFIYVKDSEGRYKYVNHKYQDLLGLPDAKCKGKTDFEFLDISVAEKIRSNEQEVLATGEPNNFEEVITVGGKQRHFISYKIPMSNRHGFGDWICNFATEITDFKKEVPVMEGHELMV